jgi:hypothetical protein
MAFSTLGYFLKIYILKRNSRNQNFNNPIYPYLVR